MRPDMGDKIDLRIIKVPKTQQYQLVALQGEPSKYLLEVYRVVYGEKGTPKKMREYRAYSGGPVGCRHEWVQFLNDNPQLECEGLLYRDRIEGEIDAVYLDGKTVQLQGGE